MNYYIEKLSGKRLKRCYDIAPNRIKQYFKSEINYVLSHARESDSVLELGCGYGRVTKNICEYVNEVTGIDIADNNIQMANDQKNTHTNLVYIQMDAIHMDFPDKSFDLVFCIQNGISAFGVDKSILMHEAIRVTRPGGKIIFSSYSESIWPDRLNWFELQSEQGLVGEIDYNRSRDGTIVCKDGFNSGTLTEMDYEILCNGIGLAFEIEEIDNSCVMCVITNSSAV